MQRRSLLKLLTLLPFLDLPEAMRPLPIEDDVGDLTWDGVSGESVFGPPLISPPLVRSWCVRLPVRRTGRLEMITGRAPLGPFGPFEFKLDVRVGGFQLFAGENLDLRFNGSAAKLTWEGESTHHVFPPDLERIILYYEDGATESYHQEELSWKE